MKGFVKTPRVLSNIAFLSKKGIVNRSPSKTTTMSNIAIKVENLSKAYQLGEIGTGTLSRDLERWWARLRGKEDPFLKIGQTNDRTAKAHKDEVVWSLRDINFEIEQGQAVGIIGRNGAGKSTLLKILSRVTSPTTGSVKLKGRVASLLEVGTGFHPELTGRENIYLNGAILGMRRAEIKRKFDEIVDFAGVEKYIDTPVKRYSSGMYVRLAFAVAAHLESEILIVDEVLAVGDAEFQKKCLGKMGDVSSKEGRTVLFVSHNMGSILKLCNYGVLLKSGVMQKIGKADEVVHTYLSSHDSVETYINHDSKLPVFLKEARLSNNSNLSSSEISFNDNFAITGTIAVNKLPAQLIVGVTLLNHVGDYVVTTIQSVEKEISQNKAEISFKLEFPKLLFAPNFYSFRIALFNNSEIFEIVENICRFRILDSGTELTKYEGTYYGNIILNHQIELYG